MQPEEKLKQAIQKGEADLIRELIDSGQCAPVRGEGVRRGSLHMAAVVHKTHDQKRETYKATLEALLNYGLDIEDLDSSLHTPLLTAVFCGWRALVEALLELGANPHAVTTDKETGLYIAASYGTPGKAQALIDAGVDIDQANINGVTPLGQALTHAREAKEAADLILSGEPSMYTLEETMEECVNALQVVQILRRAGAYRTGLIDTPFKKGELKVEDFALTHGWVELLNPAIEIKHFN